MYALFAKTKSIFRGKYIFLQIIAVKMFTVMSLNKSSYFYITRDPSIYFGGIWKFRSMVFYFSNRLTNPIMFGTILKGLSFLYIMAKISWGWYNADMKNTIVNTCTECILETASFQWKHLRVRSLSSSLHRMIKSISCFNVCEAWRASLKH